MTTTLKQLNIRFLYVLLIFSCYFPSLHAGIMNTYVKTDAHSFSSLLSSTQFDHLFPLRNHFYSYSSLQQAVHNLAQLKIKIERRGAYLYRISRYDRLSRIQTVVREDEDWNTEWAKSKEYKVEEVDYGTFCNDTKTAVNKMELSAFLAQIAHETRHGADGSFNDGLMLKEELNTTNAYLIENKTYPAAEGKKYYGRGPLQLSYNGNYGAASEIIFGSKTKLLNDPDLVAKDAVVAFETAIFFWMTPQYPKPSAHQVISGSWIASPGDRAKGHIPGFGMVTNVINGAIECNQGEQIPAMKDRMGFYQNFLRYFGVKDNRECSCAIMEPFK